MRFARMLGLTPWNMPRFEGEGAGGSGSAGAGAGGAGESGEGKGAGEGAGAGEGKPGGEKMVPETEVQAKIDAAVKERLAREKKKSDGILKQLQAQIDALNGKETPPGSEGAGGDATAAAIEAAKAEANKVLAQANQKLLEASASTEAIKLGIDPKYVSDAVKLADLSKGLKEEGTIDAAAISKSLEEVVKRMPVLKGNAGEGGSGFRVGGNGTPSQNGWNQRQPQGSAQQHESGKRWNRFNNK